MTQAHIGGTLSDALGESLTGIRHLSGWNFADHLAYLVQQFGSGRELGRQIGVAESTLRGWRKGSEPRDPYMRSWITENARALMVAQHNDWPQVGNMEIHGTVKVSNDIRDRTIHVGRHVAAHKIQAVLDRWVVGDDTGAVTDLLRAIREDYAASMYVTNTKSVRWD